MTTILPERECLQRPTSGAPFTPGSVLQNATSQAVAIELTGVLLSSFPAIGKASGIIFKTGHYVSRVEAVGLNVVKVEGIIAREVTAIRRSLEVGADVVGRTRIQGTLVEFRFRLLGNGNVNVGTIFPVM